MNRQLVSFLNPTSFEAEQYRRLRQRIEELRHVRKAQVIAVTSAVASDGKTLTALNLAGALARRPGARILLVDADLMTFGPPRCSSPLDGVGAAEGVTVPAGETCLVDLYFPFPPGLGTGDMNLDGLNLRWSVSVGERSELLGTTFARRRRTTVYYPYPDPYFRFQLGYGYRRP